VRLRAVSAVLIASLCVQCGSQAPTGPTPPVVPIDPGPGPTVPPPPVPGGTPRVFVGAADIGKCGGNSEATARLLEGIGGDVFAAGDLAYFSGTRQEFRDCYDPTWGRVRGRTHPVPGNHEYESPNAAPYFEYFGLSAGLPGLGYYSFDLGDWHVVALNSNIAVDASSLQAAWLRNDLAISRSRCTIAYWHHSLFTSGPNGSTRSMREIWRTLYDAGADVVISGHDHMYERFAPQDVDGRPDPARGVRQFVVGTGGADLYHVVAVQPNSEVQISSFGVLKLTLSSDGYEWEFVPVSGRGDTGRAMCH
jgi:calcineurin-like phosphoesterase family protein